MKPKNIDFEIVRGDNKNISIAFTQTHEGDEKSYQIIKNKVDKMYFTVKDDPSEKSYIFQKTLLNGIEFDTATGIYIIKILPEDTDNLSFASYDYDIEIINNNQKTTKLIGKLKINQEVTHYSNEG